MKYPQPIYRYRPHFGSGAWKFCENEPQHFGEWELVTTTRPHMFTPMPVGVRYRETGVQKEWTYVDLESLRAGLNLTDGFEIESIYMVAVLEAEAYRIWPESSLHRWVFYDRGLPFHRVQGRLEALTNIPHIVGERPVAWRVSNSPTYTNMRWEYFDAGQEPRFVIDAPHFLHAESLYVLTPLIFRSHV